MNKLTIAALDDAIFFQKLAKMANDRLQESQVYLQWLKWSIALPPIEKVYLLEMLLAEEKISAMQRLSAMFSSRARKSLFELLGAKSEEQEQLNAIFEYRLNKLKHRDSEDVRQMSDGALRKALDDIKARWRAFRTHCGEGSGSPGEWMVERINEIETEIERRLWRGPELLRF